MNDGSKEKSLLPFLSVLKYSVQSVTHVSHGYGGFIYNQLYLFRIFKL